MKINIFLPSDIEFFFTKRSRHIDEIRYSMEYIGIQSQVHKQFILFQLRTGVRGQNTSNTETRQSHGPGKLENTQEALCK